MKALMKWMCILLGVAMMNESFVLNRGGEERPFVVILMGPPGAGKGTHAKPLSAHFSLPHISSGDLFREHIHTQTLLGRKAKAYIDQGKLVPDDVVLDMLFVRLSLPDCKHGYILDGFPRTVSQAQSFEKRNSNALIVVLNLNVPDALLVERISGRLSCKECGRSYHTKYNPPSSSIGHCDVCKGILFQREDDRKEILKKRLEEYRVQTMPLIEYYRQKGTMKEVDASRTPIEVFQSVLHTLEVPTHV